ncbi:MAG: ABC transporter ATP-binding protein [Cellvibrionaceae bacterium]|nr:ABC transporter ATP-binding protein [Cellvibrionaceae bacterium]
MLNVINLSISFYTRNGVTQAVKDLSFSVKKGETLAIVGESGSGKSVSCQTIVGLVPSPPAKVESGAVEWQNSDLLQQNEAQLRRIRGKKISMIFQDPMTSLNPNMRIGTQIVEALLEHSDAGPAQAKQRAIEALKEVGIENAEQRFKAFPHQFSGGMRQRVMIAMALVTQPDIVIADEPTTALDVTIQAQILELLAGLQKKHQLAIIFISHDLAVVRNIADHVIVMKSGTVVESGSPQQLFEQPKHPYTKKLIDAIPSGAKPQSRDSHAENLIEIKNLSTHFHTRHGAFWKPVKSVTVAADNINISLKKGEILGLVGESGSGKSTLGRSIVRLVKPSKGEIRFAGKNLLQLSPRQMQAIRPHIQMVFQDPYASLNPRMTVYDALAEPVCLHTSIGKAELPGYIAKLLDDVGMPEAAQNKYPHEFSGGQRQRIAIARALACSPQVIIADEPVSALDVTIQEQILALLLKLNAQRGISILFISHDLSVVRYLCDRVAVMEKGRIVEINACEQVFRQPAHAYTKSLLAAIP